MVKKITEDEDDVVEYFSEEHESIHRTIDELIRYGICDSDDILDCLADYLEELKELYD